VGPQSVRSVPSVRCEWKASRLMNPLFPDPNIFYFKCDLTSNTSIASTASAVRAMVGHPTVLINNAGVGTAHTILETSDEWLQQIFHVNVISHFSLIREFLPAMLEERKGHIVTLASMASYTGTASLADYSATKAALLGLHECKSIALVWLLFSRVQPLSTHSL